jgi:hypothetical protein
VNRRTALAIPIAVSACAFSTALGEATGVLTPSGEISLAGIAKGIGQVAIAALVIANPPGAAAISALIGAVDIAIAAVQAAPTTQNVAALSDAHKTLSLAAAPNVTVVANGSPAAEMVRRRPDMARPHYGEVLG